MEVGDKTVDHLEAKPRHDKEPRLRGLRACGPAAAADSSARSVVVPTATTRPPLALVAAIASTVACGMLYHSECITCVEMSSPRTGWNVPAPTCSVTRAEAMPFATSAASIASSKCSPAVGAATAPGTAA